MGEREDRKDYGDDEDRSMTDTRVWPVNWTTEGRSIRWDAVERAWLATGYQARPELPMETVPLSDPPVVDGPPLDTAAALARYGTEAELLAFVRESLPQASEDLVRAVVAEHLQYAQRRKDGKRHSGGDGA